MKRIFFVINSHNRQAMRVWKRAKEILVKENIPYRSFFTEHKGHAEEIAKKISYMNKETVAAIVAVGGDGTIHEIFNGLKEHPEVPVTFLPGGSGNDIVRGLAPRKSSLKTRILAIYKSSSIKKMDLGEIRLLNRTNSKELFVSAIGIGLDGEVSAKANKAPYKKWLHSLKIGTIAYCAALLQVLPRYQKREVAIQVDGKDHHFSDVWLVAIGNLPYYGGGMKICPDAKATDGQLDICIVHEISILRLLLLFMTVFLGKHKGKSGVTFLRGQHILVDCALPMVIHADGEHAGTTPVEINVLPMAGRVKNG